MKVGCWLPLILLVAGIASIVSGCNAYRLGSISDAEPQIISYQKLIREGYGANAHVVLTDFKLHIDKVVVQHPKKRTVWDKVWIPVGPLDGDGNNEAIKVILISDKVHTVQELEALTRQAQMQGIVSNLTTSLARKEKDLLLQGLPGTDLDSCLLLEHQFFGSRATHPVWGIVWIGVGVVIILGSILLSMVLSTIGGDGRP